MSTSALALRALASLLVATAVTGCFPYKETYRPAIDGRVVDAKGDPVAGAPVETCSASRWVGLADGCPRKATTVSAADGSFSVPELKEGEWCCLGEAPLPFTVVSVCMPDGRIGGASFDSTVNPTAVTIAVEPARSMSVVVPRQSAARSYDPDADVKQRCGVVTLPKP